jgi:hypothetical protein
MGSLPFILSIGQYIAQALLNPAISSGKTAEWAGYLNLALYLGQLGSEANEDRKKLNDQIAEAVAAKRGLTPEQRAEWRGRNDLVDQKMKEWLAANPG